VNVERSYRYNATQNPEGVETRIHFTNDPDSRAGIPLPGGVFRVYKRDAGSLEFLGEDSIRHTPSGSRVEITVGRSFDLTAKRTVLERNRLSQRSEREIVEIELKNAKMTEDVEIQVEERFRHRGWSIEKSNFNYRKKDADTALFLIPVEAGGQTKLVYTATLSW
jgi:hypothetical protein